MPRIKLYEQEKYEFNYNTTVQMCQVNRGGRLDHIALIEIIYEARASLFHSPGMSELDLGDGQSGVIMTDLIINYKKEGFTFDELSVETHIGEITKKSMRLFHRIIRRKDGMVIALGEAGLLIYDYKKGAVAFVPESLLKVLEQATQKMPQ